jgi:FlaA1/EpsC-like NDP-sugar epimerase
MLAEFMSHTIPVKQTRLAWRTIFFLVHCLLFCLSGILAFALRFEFSIEPHYQLYLLTALPIWVAVKSLVFGLGRFDREQWSQVSAADVARTAGANLIASGVSTAILLTTLAGFPRSVYLLDLLICLQLTTGFRLLARTARELTLQSPCNEVRKRLLIYGAGAGGAMLLREMRANSSLTQEVCGFVDDDPKKQGMLVNRIPVLCSGPQLAAEVKGKNIDEVIIAIPSARGRQMAQILQYCHAANVPCRTMPGLGDFIVGVRAAAQIREVAVEDLLGRNPVHLNEERIRHKLQGRTVMVTGAGGSIGSELCLQIARFSPKSIVGLDIAESALFNVEQEIFRIYPAIAFKAAIGSIQNTQRLHEIFRQHQPTVIYHAAAYKHVPLMEEHVFEAIENNIFGTRKLATMALAYGVEDFVLISSDKAVRPTSIMGVTKRITELLTSALQNDTTKFATVRFGNVMGSNGSVIPIFQKQIAKGGPVIVTHPEMRRFFMTIPEATQLVLQASTMGTGGEIFELDMGKPVKIFDLAQNLIYLSGLRPDYDIQIKFSTPRPGEKLYEELNGQDETTMPTLHEKIKVVTNSGVSGCVLDQLQNLQTACEARDACAVVLQLKEIVPEYNPGSHLLRRILYNNAEAQTVFAEMTN